MPFEFKETTGEWVAIRDLASAKEPVRVTKGFLVDDDANQYQGKPSPRFVVQSTVIDTGEAIRTGVGKGYSRDQKLADAAAYLDEAPEGTYLDLKFVSVAGSAYIDVELAGEGVLKS